MIQLLEVIVWVLWDGCSPLWLDNRHSPRQIFIGMWTFLATSSLSAFSEVFKITLCVLQQEIDGERGQGHGGPSWGYRADT